MRRTLRFTIVMSAFILIALPACSNSVRADYPEEKILATQIGDATYYANSFQGDLTASGLRFDNRKAVAAHRTFPFGTVLRVTHLASRKSLNVVVVDRGPYGKNRREGTIIDLSRAAAAGLGMIREGQARVKIEVLRWGNGDLLGARASVNRNEGRRSSSGASK